MLNLVHPPNMVIVSDEFAWESSNEYRWGYGNISSSTKVLTASRMGAPIPVLMWQLKRYNNHLASYSSNAEGSHRMLCDLCGQFQVLTPHETPHLTHQGCSMCIGKVNLIDTTFLVSS